MLVGERSPKPMPLSWQVRTAARTPATTVSISPLYAATAASSSCDRGRLAAMNRPSGSASMNSCARNRCSHAVNSPYGRGATPVSASRVRASNSRRNRVCRSDPSIANAVCGRDSLSTAVVPSASRSARYTPPAPPWLSILVIR
jgi:hypothetical protein